VVVSAADYAFTPAVDSTSAAVACCPCSCSCYCCCCCMVVVASDVAPADLTVLSGTASFRASLQKEQNVIEIETTAKQKTSRVCPANSRKT